MFELSVPDLYKVKVGKKLINYKTRAIHKTFLGYTCNSSFISDMVWYVGGLKLKKFQPLKKDPNANAHMCDVKTENKRKQ